MNAFCCRPCKTQVLVGFQRSQKEQQRTCSIPHHSNSSLLPSNVQSQSATAFSLDVVARVVVVVAVVEVVLEVVVGASKFLSS